MATGLLHSIYLQASFPGRTPTQFDEIRAAWDSVMSRYKPVVNDQVRAYKTERLSLEDGTPVAEEETSRGVYFRAQFRSATDAHRAERDLASSGVAMVHNLSVFTATPYSALRIGAM